VNDDKLIVLSHASEEEGVQEFAANISTAVRDLVIHHPRSGMSRFVTVRFNTCLMQAGQGGASADDFLDKVLSD
jgi:hypothetical protein